MSALAELSHTLAGDDWPRIDFPEPRTRNCPTRARRDRELANYATYLIGETGLVLDPWQEWYFLESIKKRDDGKWSALECGLCVPRQNGKGDISYTTPVLTLDGWTIMGEIRVGQYVYGSDGQPTRVKARSEVFLGNTCYEVEFADGTRHTVGEDHLWRIWDSAGRNGRKGPRGRWRVHSTRQLSRSTWSETHFDHLREKTSYRYRVRCDAVPQTPHVDLPINPHAFGLWLGDGSKDSCILTAGEEDRSWMRSALTNAGLEVYREREGNGEWRPWHLSFRIPGTKRGGYRGPGNGFVGRLRRLGVYRNKHIPDCYLTASPAQRLALLQGLMDTDGSIGGQNKSPQVEFSTSIPALAEDFYQLARSLGIRVTPRWRETSRKPNCRFLWTPTFNPFRLPRKAEKYRAPSASYRHADRMSITGIYRVPSVPTRCIEVEAEDGVYLVGRTFVPTHNSVLEARELLALYADERRYPGVGGRLFVHTAHEAKTAHEGFERLQLLIEGCPRLRAKLRGKPRQSEGAEVIRLIDGRRIRFRTRVNAAGRGLSGDLLVFDEAMILSEAIHGAVWPIITARENPQIWYTGSAVDENEPQMCDHGVVFSRVRRRGIKGDDDLLWAEWGIGKPSGEDYENPEEVPREVAETPESWALSNPSLDVRLSRRIITVEQRSLSARNFARERLGVGAWPDPETSGRVIDEASWLRAAVDPSTAMLDPVCFAIDVSPDRSRAAIAVAGKNSEGRNQVEIIKRFRSTAQIIPTLTELTKARRRAEVIVDTVGSAASLIPAMEREKINVVPVTAGEHARGCGMFYDSVVADPDAPASWEPTLAHLGDPALTAAVAGAVKRPLGERWAWNRKDSTVDITTLVAATLALYGRLRKNQGPPEVYNPADILSGGDDENFSEDDLPPLDPEDLE